MIGARPNRVAIVTVLVLGSSACQIIAGIDDKKASLDVPIDGGAGNGGSPAVGGSVGIDGGGGLGGSSLVVDAPGSDGFLAGGGGSTGSGGQSVRLDAGVGGVVSGGASGTGGLATGDGSYGTGGGSTGGLTGTSAGGTPGTGGAITGGAPGTGGTATGGAPGTGGAMTGGATTGGPMTGGASGTGGMGTGGSNPDASTTPDAPEDAPGCPAVGVLGNGTGLLGEYFIGTDLTALALSRIDPSLDFTWSASPDVGIPADSFSVRWTGQVQPRYSGTYTFFTNSDDGIRVWVGGTLIPDDWTPAHSPKEASAILDLVAGQKYDIKVEQYEQGGLAVAQLSWMSDCQAREVIPSTQLYPPPQSCAAPSTGTGTGLQGQYFDNPDFTAFALTRNDPIVSFVWPTGTAPDASLAPDDYSIRFTGQVEAKYTGSTTFYLVSDDGARLFINDQMVIDDWSPHGRTEDLATLNLIAGQKYDIRIDYHDGVGGGQVQLLWGSPCQAKEIIPQAQLYPTYTGLVCPLVTVGSGSGLRGEYFASSDFTQLAVTHPAEAVSFDWGWGAPDPAMEVDDFSVRWTGQIEPRYTGPTTFWTVSDDAVKLWVNGQVLIDNTTYHAATEDSGTINLTAGQKVDIQVDYQEGSQAAIIRLLWSGACQPKDVVPAAQLYPDTGASAGAGG